MTGMIIVLDMDFGKFHPMALVPGWDFYFIIFFATNTFQVQNSFFMFGWESQ